MENIFVIYAPLTMYLKFLSIPQRERHEKENQQNCFNLSVLVPFCQGFPAFAFVFSAFDGLPRGAEDRKMFF